MTRCRCSRRPWIRPPRSWGPTAISSPRSTPSASATARRPSCCSAPVWRKRRAAISPGWCASFREAHPRHNGVAILTVNTPDFFGSMENGYSAVIESVIEQWVAPTPRPGQRPRRVNLLVSHLCSPGDIEWLGRCVEAFGLQPVILPDLSQSMDGHLGEGDFTPLTRGRRLAAPDCPDGPESGQLRHWRVAPAGGIAPDPTQPRRRDRPAASDDPQPLRYLYPSVGGEDVRTPRTGLD